MTFPERQERIDELRQRVEDYSYNPASAQFYNELIDYITNDKAAFPNTANYQPTYNNYLVLTIFAPIHAWEAIDYRLFEVISHKDIWGSFVSYSNMFVQLFFGSYVAKQMVLEDEDIAIMPFLINIWDETNRDRDELLGAINGLSASFWYKRNEKEGQKSPSSFGLYIVEQAKDNLSGVLKIMGNTIEGKNNLFALFMDVAPEFAEENYKKFLTIQTDLIQGTSLSVNNAKALLKRNAEKYEPILLGKMEEVTSMDCKLEVYELLYQFFPKKYEVAMLEKSREYMRDVMTFVKKGGNMSQCANYWDYETRERIFIIIKEVKKLLAADAENAKPELIELYEYCNSGTVKSELLQLLYAAYGADILPSMMKDSGVNVDDSSYLFDFFKTLEKLDYAPYLDTIWGYLTSSSRPLKQLTVTLLAKRGDSSIENASALLQHKKADTRQMGASLLSLINTPASLAVLSDTLDNETDDNTRDIMLQSLQGILPPPKDEAELKDIIAKAKKRKKLDKFTEKGLNENDLPALYWQSGSVLDTDAIRFLFYRQARSKDIRIEAEAKLLLPFLDKTKSQPFANALLKAFIANGADSKAKYCMPLATSLGANAEIDLLKSKVLEWVDNSRGKMAEYAVKAIALNGSNKALRLIEFYSRKYKNTYKNIGAAANESFVLVAEELGIPPHELADSIIPDFDFDGLFKPFEAGGESYRAFVSNDFKILFLDDDNKLIKTVPKAASAELKAEFKDITKEIKDIVKSQTGRLEQSLITQRRWDSGKWQALFLNNPIMFAYAVRLIWGVYAADGSLLYAFRCTEDQALLNNEEEEIELDDDCKIGIVHPITLDETAIAYWTDSMIDADITPIFTQLMRPVIRLQNEDKDIKIYKKFAGIEYNGYSFVGKMDKLGWNRGSVADGGSITSYFKDFAWLGVTAIIEQTGVLSVGYYEENAELGNLYFVKSKSIKFGSYVYDEPRDETDNRLLLLGSVPQIIYSEIMTDLTFFKENDEKKQV